ncbi:MAG: secondary thiamine-phosphate synthase enzyme YjbQ [Burkholderiales bacterium]
MTTKKIVIRQPALNRLRLRLKSNSKARGNGQRHQQVVTRRGASACPVPLKQGWPERASGFQVAHHALELQTTAPLQFIDLTDEVCALVAQSGVANGMVNVQTRHTTTAVIINEHEPLLLEDLKELLTRLAPPQTYYRHNDFAIRTANMTPDESPNGHAHCQSLLLSSAATVNIIDGALQLGRWQRIFFIELDHARPRTVSLTVMGQAATPNFAWD